MARPAPPDSPLTTAVLIPALNCAGTIAEVVRGARRFVESVVVVNDGSGDVTATLAAAAGAEVVAHDATRGKGAALQTGMELLALRGVTHALTMDGDGQHLSDQIPVLLQASQADPHALIIGARDFAGVTMAPSKLFGNRFANRWVEIACGQTLPDTQSGFRIYPLPATMALGARSQHFGYETEVLIRAARGGMPIRSVPVRVYYPPPAERVSHFRPVVDTVRIIFIVLGLLFRVL